MKAELGSVKIQICCYLIFLVYSLRFQRVSCKLLCKENVPAFMKLAHHQGPFFFNVRICVKGIFYLQIKE